MKQSTSKAAMASTSFASTECGAQSIYMLISKTVIALLKTRERAITVEEFIDGMKGCNIPVTCTSRLFEGIVKFLMIESDHKNYTFPKEVRSDIEARLTADRIELICLTHKVFQTRGRHAADAEQKRLNQIQIVSERCKASKGQADDPMKTLVENLYTDLEKIDASINVSALDIKTVEDKLNEMKRTHQKLLDERKSIEKSISNKEKLMAICKTMKMSVEEIKSLL